MPSFTTEIFRSDGIFLGAETATYDSWGAAVAAAPHPLARDRKPGANYCIVSTTYEPPKDGICPRCGSSVGACGGPKDPHE